MSGQKPTAIILTNGMLRLMDAKTAHGLIRGTDRFKIAAVIDNGSAGRDAGEILDGRFRGIPVLPDVDDALTQIPGIKYCIIGVATSGGLLPPHFLPLIKKCISHRISVVNGLHEFLSEKPELVSLALKYGVELTDVRKPKPLKELHFWTGEIYSVEAPVIAVLGTDCATGKRTTCRNIAMECQKNNIHAQTIYTGQTGWMQGGRYGFIFDSTLNDFISGELEHAIVSCWKETRPDLILIEGQSALRNPSGPCGSEMLVSGNARHVVLIHAPKRKYYENEKSRGIIHSVASEIELIKMYGSAVIALALNTENCSAEEARQFQKQYEEELKLPVVLPLQEGMEKIIPAIRSLLKS